MAKSLTLNPENKEEFEKSPLTGEPIVPQPEFDPTEGMDDSKESKKILKEHKEFTEKLAKGEVNTAGLSAIQLAEINKPLVAAPNGGKPVYETASQWLAAETAKGNLATPSED